MKLKLLPILLLPIYADFASAPIYDIEEQYLLVDIENKKPEVEKEIERQKKVAIKKLDDLAGEKLTPAPANRTKYVDPTYVLQQDIPKYDRFGKKVGVLYKKGYKFNPIDYLHATPADFIIFNPCNSAEALKVTEIMSEYEKESRDYMLVNSGCKNKDLKKNSFNGKVYFLTAEMKDKFKVEHTISIIYVDKEKKRIAVKEIATNEKTSN
ncbi:MAG: hypothetical protein RBS91_08455 [Sulfurimonadaceae bacterium]|nr:hypothetical protein [Sulfurimonadaceae bacterium]